jgi:hypothetical protein
MGPSATSRGEERRAVNDRIQDFIHLRAEIER